MLLGHPFSISNIATVINVRFYSLSYTVFNFSGEEITPSGRFITRPGEEIERREIDVVARQILDTLGIEIEEPEGENYLEIMISRFGNNFPKTAIFSSFARSTLPEVSSLDDPDTALVAWMNQEEMLFRTLERHIVDEQLRLGFVVNNEVDVELFVKYSLGVHNRRKSRTGHALEHHLSKVFEDHQLHFDKEPETESKSKPDFLFPGIDAYHNTEFPAQFLTMLGAKTTCKDRWRQVLAEAARITQKHLFTMEAAISENQTNQMQANYLQLVLPNSIHKSYKDSQKSWLMDMASFIKMVSVKQSMISRL